MTNVQAIRILQDAASHLVAQERTTAVSMAENVISDAILALWNDVFTNRVAYWQRR